MRIFLAGLTAAAGTFAFLCGLLYWFWRSHRSLGPVSGEFVPYLGGVPATLAVWGWAIRDAARSGSHDPPEGTARA